MKLSRRFVIAFILGLILVICGDLVLKATGRAKAELWGAEVAGYWAAFGLLWVLVISFVAKRILDPWLHRREDYYEDSEAEDE
ncbi:MAG: hypothetical protein FJ039_12180 [Chloroflexi bacterium]|nr:hypothetical protein [Chloroflexota bacterium]